MKTKSETAEADMTLEQHAEAWWTQQGRAVPARKSKAWDVMYAQWIEFAFRDFANPHTRSKKGA